MYRAIKKNSEVNVSENKVWKGLRQGDLNSLGMLYDLYVDQLFSVGMKMIKDRHLVQDQIHELFLDLYKYHEKLGEVQNVGGYLVTSFKRKIFKQNNFKITHLNPNWEQNLKSVSKELKVTKSHEEELISNEEANERSGFLRRTLANLTEHQRSILRMRFTEDRSYEEIADSLRLSVASTRTLLYRTLKSIRKTAFSLFF